MAPKPLKGYRRLPGSAHRYLTPSGKNISEYQYRSRKARRVKDAQGRRLYKNAYQQRKFRESQDFLRLRFNIRSIDPSQMTEAGSDLEAAAFELSREPGIGQGGAAAAGAKANTRFGQLLAAQGAPDWYFWRFWYSETSTR